MKRFVAVCALLFAAATPLMAQDQTAKAFADTMGKANTLGYLTYTFKNELGARQVNGQAVCVDPTGVFMTYGIAAWTRSADFSNGTLSFSNGKSVKVDFMWVDPETGLGFVKASEKGEFVPAKFEDTPSFTVGSLYSSVGLLEGDPSHAAYVSAGRVAAVLQVPERLVMVTGGTLTGEASPVFSETGAVVGVVSPQPFMHFVLSAPQQGSTDVYLKNLQMSTFFRPTAEFSHVLQYVAANPLKPRQLPWIGVLTMAGTAKDKFDKDLPSPGVVVGNVVTNANGEKGGLKNEDIIVELNGKPLEKFVAPEMTGRWLERQIIRMPVDGKVTFTVVRGTEKVPVTVALEPMPAKPIDAPRWISLPLGMIVREKVMLDEYLTKGPTAKAPGLLVTDVAQRSPGDNAGVKPNDLITTVDGQRVSTVAAFKAIVEKSIAENPNRVINISIQRGDQVTNFQITPMIPTPTSAPAK